jgi:hypothetical protein
MFMHAFIDGLKACNDAPEPIVEAITGTGATLQNLPGITRWAKNEAEKKGAIERILV